MFGLQLLAEEQQAQVGVPNGQPPALFCGFYSSNMFQPRKVGKTVPASKRPTAEMMSNLEDVGKTLRDPEDLQRNPPGDRIWFINSGISIYPIWVIQAEQVPPVLPSHQTRMKKNIHQKLIHQKDPKITQNSSQVQRHQFRLTGNIAISAIQKSGSTDFPAFTTWRCFRLDALLGL